MGRKGRHKIEGKVLIFVRGGGWFRLAPALGDRLFAIVVPRMCHMSHAASFVAFSGHLYAL